MTPEITVGDTVLARREQGAHARGMVLLTDPDDLDLYTVTAVGPGWFVAVGADGVGVALNAADEGVYWKGEA
jgi:hypothetical protein